jgi:hypothetical protein
MTVALSLPKSNTNNKVNFSGEISISEDILGQIDLVIEANKCSLDMKTCEKAPTVNIKDMCSKFKDSLYSSVFSKFQPAFVCPLRKGKYMIKEAAIDLTILTYVPLDGFIYVCSMKFVSIENSGKKKQLVMCLNSETKIVKIRVKS